MSKIVKEDDIVIKELSSNIIDITGREVGKNGYVIGYSGGKRWYVKCSCGVIFETKFGSKSQKPINSCQMCSGYIYSENKKISLIGQNF